MPLVDSLEFLSSASFAAVSIRTLPGIINHMGPKAASNKPPARKRPYSRNARDPLLKKSAQDPNPASDVSIPATASSDPTTKQTSSAPISAPSSSYSRPQSSSSVSLKTLPDIQPPSSPEYYSDPPEYCFASSIGHGSKMSFRAPNPGQRTFSPEVTSNPRSFSPVVASDPRGFSPVVTSGPRVFSPMGTSDPRGFSPVVTSDPRAFSPMVAAKQRTHSPTAASNDGLKLRKRAIPQMSYSSFLKQHSSMPRSHSPDSSLLGYSPTSPDFSGILRESSPDLLRPMAKRPKLSLSAMPSDDEKMDAQPKRSSASPMVAPVKKPESVTRPNVSKDLQTKSTHKRSADSSGSVHPKIDPNPQLKKTRSNATAHGTGRDQIDPRQGTQLVSQSVKTRKDGSQYVDLTLDSDEEIMQPKKSYSGTVDSDPEIKRFPTCEPGSSLLSFSMCFEKIFENWTDPHPSSTKRKNNCTILLAGNSPERAAVVDNFLRSFNEGSMKLKEEMSRYGDSTACKTRSKRL